MREKHEAPAQLLPCSRVLFDYSHERSAQQGTSAKKASIYFKNMDLYGPNVQKYGLMDQMFKNMDILWTRAKIWTNP